MKKTYKHKTAGYIAVQNAEKTGYLVQFVDMNGRTTSHVLPNEAVENHFIWEEITGKTNLPSLN